MSLALQKSEIPTTADEVLTEIQKFPQWIASELRPLLAATDIEIYKHFLVTMYHYTYHAEEQLIHAANCCENPELKSYFKEMAHEERGHYLIAKRDYEEFGLNVEDSAPPPSVQSFRDYWYRLGQNNVNEFVGAMYVFENVAMAVGKDIRDMIARLNLTKKQARWLWVHLEADIGHGNEAWEMCSKYAQDNPQALYVAAEEGAREWMDVFRYAFSK
jgi:hypothetical protein